MKTQCTLKVVYLKKNNKEIPYGDLTTIAGGLPKMEKIKVNGKVTYKPIHYEQSFYEQWQHKETERIVAELNDLLPNACINQKTMYYFTKEEQVMVAL